MKQTDIFESLELIQSGKKLWTSMDHKQRIHTLMLHFEAKGIPLSVCADSRHLGRAESTLKKYARAFNMKFPDYVPRCLRERAKRTRRKKAAEQ